MDLNRKLLEEENNRLRSYLGWIAIVAMVVFLFWGADHRQEANDLVTIIFAGGPMLYIIYMFIEKMIKKIGKK